MSWRPKDWDNPFESKYDWKKDWATYERGADAMLKALEKEVPIDLFILTDPEDPEEDNNVETN